MAHAALLLCSFARYTYVAFNNLEVETAGFIRI
jgi:hypothetical protein